MRNHVGSILRSKRFNIRERYIFLILAINVLIIDVLIIDVLIIVVLSTLLKIDILVSVQGGFQFVISRHLAFCPISGKKGRPES